MSAVTVQNLVKTYASGGRRATDDVSLEVADGEFLVLVGPSGCGKTTLLRMVAGLETPDSGRVSIGGRDVTDLPARERGLSMVFQSYAIFPHMRVRQNIGFGLTMRKVPRDEFDRRVARAAELLRLTDYLDRYPAQLSGGQRQRVAVARAIVVDAAVLLMDEPLSNLDALLRLQFRAELKRIVSQLGTTTLYVTHDQAEAMSLGDRVAVMRDGRVAQLGPPLSVYDRPSDRFVGGFLGSPPMNFLTARVRDGLLAIGDASLPAPDQLSTWDGRDVVVGVRAENIQVSAQARPGWLPARVEVVEPTGAALLLTVRLGDEQLKVQAPTTFQATPDQPLHLYAPQDSLRFYDPETSLALPLTSPSAASSPSPVTSPSP
ncbi:ABC transporter ATP-binding protein [Phytohabitans suffuscus]|uniref:Sugar ABC transporter ATP-binding protein n=1 Tax=Phytohabitans suffuscus TaxID=624315 RepID=A0A6F8YZX8_9ACTN|nr:ABC transporter ATP-binding protein [Phytohabitans suffuscus]BCB91639.1 sugar ABC transporter ATP-binding protein [Phytohabitans suffuscus]